MTKDNYYLSNAMKKYINTFSSKYNVGGGNLIVNRSVACTKTTREGHSRADTSDYLCEELMENENVKGQDLTKYRIRKLTPKECWRLMGMCKRKEDGTFDDEPFEKAKQVCSNAQLYKQAGNSIVVDVLEAIFKQML